MQTSVTDENNNTTQFTYGSKDDYVIYVIPSKTTYANGTEIEQEIDYLGRIKKTAIADLAKIDYTYAKGSLKTITRTKNTGEEAMPYTFTYDLFGNTTKTMVGNVTLANYTYGANNGLTITIIGFVGARKQKKLTIWIKQKY